MNRWEKYAIEVDELHKTYRDMVLNRLEAAVNTAHVCAMNGEGGIIASYDEAWNGEDLNAHKEVMLDDLITAHVEKQTGRECFRVRNVEVETYQQKRVWHVEVLVKQPVWHHNTFGEFMRDSIEEAVKKGARR